MIVVYLITGMSRVHAGAAYASDILISVFPILLAIATYETVAFLAYKVSYCSTCGDNLPCYYQGDFFPSPETSE